MLVKNNGVYFINITFRSFLIGVVVVFAGCKSQPPPVVVLPPAPLPDPPPVEVRVDDIPPTAKPSVRAHLLLIREMRDLGQISEAQYQSRRVLLLQQP